MSDDRIKKALSFIIKYGNIDGAHHKDWVLDQVTRALTGCPIVEQTVIDCNSEPYIFEMQGESKEYQQLVADTCAGEDGPDTYDWSVGTPP